MSSATTVLHASSCAVQVHPYKKSHPSVQRCVIIHFFAEYIINVLCFSDAYLETLRSMTPISFTVIFVFILVNDAGDDIANGDDIRYGALRFLLKKETTEEQNKFNRHPRNKILTPRLLI